MGLKWRKTYTQYDDYPICRCSCIFLVHMHALGIEPASSFISGDFCYSLESLYEIYCFENQYKSVDNMYIFSAIKIESRRLSRFIT